MRKPDIYVLLRFLDIQYKNSKPMKKTNIQLLVGLRYPRFIEYLDWLVQRGLVERISDVEEGAELYQLSARGLDAYRRLIEWMNEVIQDMTLEKLVE